jgi:hypothetical protein
LTLVWCWRDVEQAGIETAECEQAIIKTVFSRSDFRLQRKSDVKVHYGLASVENVPVTHSV